MVAIVGVAAFQNLAMTTVMPEISRDLDGQTLYALAFAAPLAAGVPGMVLAATGRTARAAGSSPGCPRRSSRSARPW